MRSVQATIEVYKWEGEAGGAEVGIGTKGSGTVVSEATETK